MYLSGWQYSISGGIYIQAKDSSDGINGTIYLEKHSSRSWTNVTKWSFNGTCNVFLSKSYTGISGVEYRVRVAVTVDSENAEAISENCEVK